MGDSLENIKNVCTVGMKAKIWEKPEKKRGGLTGMVPTVM